MNPPEKHPGWLRPELVVSWRQIFGVLCLSIGYFVLSSTILASFRLSGHPPDLRASNYRLLHLLAVESCLLAGTLGFLHWRGWRASDFKISLGKRSTVHGLLLLYSWIAILSLSTAFRRYEYLHHFLPHASSVLKPRHLHLGWLVLIFSQVINAFSEELIVMGYAFNQLAAKRGPGFALVVTLLLRMSYHTWKAPVFLAVTALHFLIFSLYYQRARNLWPLILAHALFDIYVFAPFVSGLY